MAGSINRNMMKNINSWKSEKILFQFLILFLISLEKNSNTFNENEVVPQCYKNRKLQRMKWIQRNMFLVCVNQVPSFQSFFFSVSLTETLWYLWLDSFENNINKKEKEEHYAFLISKDLILISHTKQSLLMRKMYNTWHSLRRNHVQQKVSWSGLKAKNEKKNHPQFM